MALLDSNYRIHLDITYSSTANGTTARNALNAALSGLGRPETAGGSGAQVTLLISGITTEAEAISIRDSILSAWSGSARTGGKVGIARSNA